MDAYVEAAQRLHAYLMTHHWDGDALVGPDPGIRFTYRVGRFIKSYLPARRWDESLCYMQAQGYWVLANWRLFDLTGNTGYRDTAVRCSNLILHRQRPDGAWEYPNPEWKGRIATTEGAWASLGLLQTYRQTAEARFLNAVLKWHTFLVQVIGFQQTGDRLAVNYFAGRQGSRIPNNSAFALRLLAALADATGDDRYLQSCDGLLTFMRTVQQPSGEFPYAVEGVEGGPRRDHFQCYQYNAFQCLDLIHYVHLTGDPTALPLIARVLQFLRSGIAADGHAYYDCGNRHRAVTYHAAALAAASVHASQLGIDGYDALATQAYQYVLGLQNPDGAFRYSRRDYYVLSDRRSYPRYLSMILTHLLEPVILEDTSAGKEDAYRSVR